MASENRPTGNGKSAAYSEQGSNGGAGSMRLVSSVDVQLRADFGTRADYPLVKTKFALFNSGIASIERYRRDASLLSNLRADSLRIDLGWGADWIRWTHEPILGTLDNIRYDFREMDEVAKLLTE